MPLDETAALGLPLPHPDNNPRDVDVPRLRTALTMLDTLVSDLQADKADKTQVAADIAAAINALKGSAPAAYDTLIEIAEKLGDNDDVVAGILTTLGLKANAADVTTALAAEVTARNAAIATAVSAEAVARAAAIAAIPKDGKRAFVASGSLPDGAVVSLRSDGKIEVTEGAVKSVGTKTTFHSARAESIVSCMLDDTRIAVAYSDYINSGRGMLVIGTVSGADIFFGTPQVFANVNTAQDISICAPSSSLVVIAFVNGTVSPTYGQLVAASITGTVATFGAVREFETSGLLLVAIEAMSASTGVVMWRNTGSNIGYMRAFSLTGTTINLLGSNPLQFSDTVATYLNIRRLDETRFIIGYVYAGGNAYCYVAVGALVGETLTLGTRQLVEGVSSVNVEVVVLSESTAVVLRSANSLGFANIVSIGAGNTISEISNKVQFLASSPSEISAKATGAATFVAIFYGPGAVMAIGGEIVAGNLIFGPTSVIYSAYGSPLSLSVRGNTATVSMRENNPYYGSSFTITLAADNHDTILGITDGASADGEIGLVTTLGGVADNLSGLTTRADYYVSSLGTLTTTPSDYKLGKALSPTDMLITGGAL
jgi:hypothetical protein